MSPICCHLAVLSDVHRSSTDGFCMHANLRKSYLKGQHEQHTAGGGLECARGKQPVTTSQTATRVASAVIPYAGIQPPTLPITRAVAPTPFTRAAAPCTGEQHTMHAPTARPASSGAGRLRHCLSAPALASHQPWLGPSSRQPAYESSQNSHSLQLQ